MIAGDLPNRIETLHDGIAGSVRAYKKDGFRSEGPPRSGPRQARVSKSLFGLVHKKTVRELVLGEGIRWMVAVVEEIRPITVEVGLLPRAHGSGLFTRG